MRLIRTVLALCLFAVAGLASATNYTLWINGRTGGGTIGDYNSFSYWGPSSTAAGVNKKAVNWDGYNSIASQSGHIRDALDCFCTGNNWCYIATHSAGDLMMVSVLLRIKSSGILDEYPNLATYLARGEARPAYKRAFDAQLAVNTRKP